MDGHDRVLAVVLAAEHFLRFARFDLGGEVVQRAGELVADGLAGFDPFGQDRQVLEPAPQGFGELAVFFQPPAALQQLLRGGLILPEVWSANALLYPRQFGCGTCGVKDGSAGQRRAVPDPDVCEAVRRGGWPYRAVNYCS
jgi:hypothetical protein